MHRSLIALLAAAFAGCSTPTVSSGPLPCSQQADRTPGGIDDIAILKHLRIKGEELIRAGRTKDIKGLYEQARGRKTCSLRLPNAPVPCKSPVEVYQKRKRSVLVVGGLYKCGKCDNLHVSGSTGFVLTREGHFISNVHTIDKDREKVDMVVMTDDRRVFPVVEVMAANAGADVSILRFEIPKGEKPPEPVPLGTLPQVGADVSIIHHPTSNHYLFTTGVVSRYVQRLSKGVKVNRMMVSADFAKGSSGAPVFDAAGSVVGIVVSTRSVYYTQSKDGDQKNLQMVLRFCATSNDIRALLGKKTF